MSKYRYNPITSKLDLTDGLTDDEIIEFKALSSYLNFNNVTPFSSTNALAIDYSELPRTPVIQIYISDILNNIELADPIIVYDFLNKSITVSFDGKDETGFIIIT
jgi:hypothetical protein